MLSEVILPKQGLQMTEGYITKWFFNVGDGVNKGDPLFEMETDKTVITVESSYSGTLLKILHEAGDTVSVATVIGYIGDDNDKVVDLPISETITQKPDKVEVELKPIIKKEKHVFITPRAKTIALQNGVAIESIVPSGPDGLIIARDVKVKSKQSSNADMLAVKVSFAGVMDIIDKLDVLSVIDRCLVSVLKRCKVGDKFQAKDFNVRYLGNSNVSFFFSSSDTPSLYVGKPDKDNFVYITFTWDADSITSDEALELAGLLYLFIERPLLAFVE